MRNTAYYTEGFMQINKDYESETNLKKLFFHILYRWRSIAAVALLCAVVFGVYQYLTVKAVHDAGKQTKDERQYEYDLVTYQEKKQNNESIIRVLSKRLQEQNEYRDESIYIQLDAQGVWKATNRYLVSVDQSVLEAIPAGVSIDPADNILAAYSAPLSNVEDDQMLIDAFGTEKTEYISELVEVETETLDNSVTVYVLGSSKEAVQKGMELINTQMEALSTGKAQQIQGHKLILLSEDIAKGPDKLLQEAQEKLVESMEDNQKLLQTAREELEEVMSRPEPTEPGMNLRGMMTIGFAIGLFLLIAIYTMSYLFGGKLRDLSVFTEKYGLPEFGRFEKSSSIHSDKSFDRLFSKWELHNKERKEETVYANIAALIAEQTNIRKVLLASTLPEGKLNTLKEKLVSALPDTGIEIQTDFIHDNEAVTRAGKADAVILAEETQISRVHDIELMMNSLMISKANVIGYISL